MDIHLCVVGKLRAGPEKTLIDDYLDRFDRSGRLLGLSSVEIHEIADKRGGGPTGEAAMLRRVVPNGSWLCVLDERGREMGSPDFAGMIARLRDEGRPAAAFAIGGADGIDPSLRAEADFNLSFGPMVWPHMLARVMLAEQLYRAASILAGSPYHRV